MSEVRRDHRLPLLESDNSSTNLTGLASNFGLEMARLEEVESGSESNTAMINARDASFSWTADGDPVVRNLTFEIKQGQLCFLIGPVGSGKSTLLKGLLGETPSSQGFVYSNTSAIAFVDQIPWVRNGTIMDNILGISAFEEKWYNQVVSACALTADIAILPRGHSELTDAFKAHNTNTDKLQQRQ